MAQTTLGALLVLASISLIASDIVQRGPISNVKRKRTVSDPVSGFFSELGDLFLDVDRTFSVQTAPKVQNEDNIVSQIFRPTADYFDRVQKNYRNMQKRLGKLIGNALGQKDAYSDHELSTVSPLLVAREPTDAPPTLNSVNSRGEFNPFAEADKARRLSFRKRTSAVQTNPEDECSNEIIMDPVLEHLRREKCARIATEQAQDFKRIDMKRANEMIRSKKAEKFSVELHGRQGDIPEDSENSPSDSDTEHDFREGRSSDVLSDECSNEMLTDPVLEHFRKEKCARIAIEEQARELKKLVIDPKRISELLRSKNADKLSKEFLGRLGDFAERNIVSRSSDADEEDEESDETDPDISDECSSEMLADPLLGHLRKEKCARIAAEQEKDLPKLTDSKRVSEILSSKPVNKLTKNLLNRLGEVSSELTRSFSSSIDDSEECPNEILDDPILENLRREKCLRIASEERIKKELNKIMLDSKKAGDLLVSLGSKAVDPLLNGFSKRMGDDADSQPEEGVIIDASYSESFFDNRLRQLLKDHGQWLLENPLLNSWRRLPKSDQSAEDPNIDSSESEETTTMETIPDVATETEATEIYIPTTEYQEALSKSGQSLPGSSLEASDYYTIVNDDGVAMDEDVHIVFKPLLSDEIESAEEMEQKDSVLLAFTPDGVPLKLRMGPEIENPLGYLHKALKSAGVSLNIPIDSYDDLEPVGKEVLKLGSGILTRAVYIDVSNNNELKSLLKTLMNSKTAEK